MPRSIARTAIYAATRTVDKPSALVLSLGDSEPDCFRLLPTNMPVKIDGIKTHQSMKARSREQGRGASDQSAGTAFAAVTAIVGCASAAQAPELHKRLRGVRSCSLTRQVSWRDEGCCRLLGDERGKALHAGGLVHCRLPGSLAVEKVLCAQHIRNLDGTEGQRGSVRQAGMKIYYQVKTTGDGACVLSSWVALHPPEPSPNTQHRLLCAQCSATPAAQSSPP